MQIKMEEFYIHEPRHWKMGPIVEVIIGDQVIGLHLDENDVIYKKLNALHPRRMHLDENAPIYKRILTLYSQ